MRKFIWVAGFIFACVGAASVRGAGDGPPAWAYGLPPLPEGTTPPPTPTAAPEWAGLGGPPPGARRGGGPGRAAGPARQGGAGRAAPAPRRVEGSTREFMSNEISNGFGPADWFPEDHPPMPDLVAHGRQDTSTRACALCHMPNGKGRPENAPVGGQPYEYIIQQLNDFRAGLRYSSEPRKENTAEMIHIAKTLSDDDMQTVARYFSAIKWTPWIRVVEADQVPTTRLAGNIFYSLENGETEPIGHRIIEMPENNQQTQLRNPRSGFVAYVPTGSLAKGKALVTTGGDGKTTPCAICHGPELLGIGTIPGIAGRSPSYLTRQIYDIKLGTRHGAMAALMKPVVEHLSDDDVIAVVAYVSSLKP